MTDLLHDVIWLSDLAHARLTARLTELEGPLWTDVVDRVSRARDEGDLKENGGYHAAREELGKLDGEVKELKAVLEAAVTELPAADTDTVVPGMVVGVQWGGSGDAEPVLVADRRMDDFLDIEVISPQTPMMTALAGHRVGEVVAYDAPNGRTMKVGIASLTPFTAEFEQEHLTA